MSIYRFCGDSQKGASHEANGTVCQDAHYILERNDFVVAAVADGLGSSKHSDIASKMAASLSVECCIKNIRKGMPDSAILSVIKTAFDNANFAIKLKANDCLDDYDTTLTLAVFMGGLVYFGHAGDSGIIALRSDGMFEEVTQPQLGAGVGKDRPVYPLAAESHWVFDKYKHRAHALFLMTDGVLGKVTPPLLENQRHKLNHAYLYYVYDNLRKNPELGTWVSEELSLLLPQEVNHDDKTLVAVMCNTAKISDQPKGYYKFPSKALWESLIEEQNRKLYCYRYPPSGNPPGDPPGGDGEKPNKLRRYAIVFAAGFILGVITALIIALPVNNTVNDDTPDPPPPITMPSATPRTTPSDTPTQQSTTPPASTPAPESPPSSATQPDADTESSDVASSEPSQSSSEQDGPPVNSDDDKPKEDFGDAEDLTAITNEVG